MRFKRRLTPLSRGLFNQLPQRGVCLSPRERGARTCRGWWPQTASRRFPCTTGSPPPSVTNAVELSVLVSSHYERQQAAAGSILWAGAKGIASSTLLCLLPQAHPAQLPGDAPEAPWLLWRCLAGWRSLPHTEKDGSPGGGG